VLEEILHLQSNEELFVTVKICPAPPLTHFEWCRQPAVFPPSFPRPERSIDSHRHQDVCPCLLAHRMQHTYTSTVFDLRMRSEVLTALKMSLFVLQVVTPCGLAGTYRRFGGGNVLPPSSGLKFSMTLPLVVFIKFENLCHYHFFCPFASTSYSESVQELTVSGPEVILYTIPCNFK
jgi:hypothetical protein